MQEGPDWALALNQKAHSQTLAPGAVLGGKVTLNVVRVVFPWNTHPDSSVGATGPTNANTAAPATPAGFPRRVVEVLSCRRMRTVLPTVSIMSSPGGSLGGGIGAGS